MSRRRSWIAIGVCVALAALVWKRGDLLDGGQRSALVGAREARPSGRAPRTEVHPLDKAAGRPAARQRATSDEAHDRALADYLESSKYPPMSRPLRDTDQHLVRWNRRYEDWRPSEADARLEVRFTADRYFMIGSEPLDVRFEAVGAPVLDVRAHAAPVDAAGAPGTSIPIELKPSADPGVFEARFVAPEMDRAVRYVLTATYSTDAARAESVTFNVEHTPEAAAPARFTGAHRSVVEEGSLAVYAEVSVREAGSYLFDANLFLSDEPVAWTRFKGSLEPGIAEVRLVFFGKVLADHRAAHPGGSGTFQVRQLRGARYRESTEPELAQMQPFVGALDTGVGPSEAFSDAAYESAHKAAKLARLRALADSGRGIDLPSRR